MKCNILGTNKLKAKEYDNQVGQRDSPLQIQLIKFLGLKNYFMDKFVFRRKPSKYKMVKKLNKNVILHPHLYQPCNELTAQVQLIQSQNHSIPLLFLKHKKPISNVLIIYSHGNSSDLSESIVFLEGLAIKYGCDVLGYDYSGYGQSKAAVIGEQTIVKDLELVISWTKIPLNRIILWGFSLGSYPTVCNAAKFRVGGMVLHCPIASVNSIFEEGVTTKTKFKEDHFSNLQKINSVNCWTFIVHTLQDEIIPISHSRLLFQKFSQTNGKDKIWFLQVQKAKHNGLHKYFISKHTNDLKQEFTSFIRRIEHESFKTKSEQQCLLRLHNRFMIVQSQLINQQFYQQQYEIQPICETMNNPMASKFNQKRTYIPRCFD